MAKNKSIPLALQDSKEPLPDLKANPLAVVAVYKDLSLEGGWSSGYVIAHFEIDLETLKKHGNLVSQTNPETFTYIPGMVERKIREVLGI